MIKYETIYNHSLFNHPITCKCLFFPLHVAGHSQLTQSEPYIFLNQCECTVCKVATQIVSKLTPLTQSILIFTV